MGKETRSGLWYLGLPACFFKQFKFICAVSVLVQKPAFPTVFYHLTSAPSILFAPSLTEIPGPWERKVLGFSLEVSHCLFCGPLWVSVFITISDDSWEKHWSFIAFVDFECCIKCSINFQASQAT